MTINYVLNWSAGLSGPKLPITVPDGATWLAGLSGPTGASGPSTSLTLSGRGSINWGFDVQQNLLHVLENFASPTGPKNATLGQSWFDMTTGNLNVNTGVTGPNWSEIPFTSAVASIFGVTGPFTVGTPTSTNDAVPLGYLTVNYASIGGVTNPFTVSGPFGSTDAINQGYADGRYAPIAGVTTPFEVGYATSPLGAVPKGQADATYANIAGSLSQTFNVSIWPTGPTGQAGPAIPLAFADSRYQLVASGSIRPEIKQIFAVPASNALSFGLKTGEIVDFRSATLDDGTVIHISASSDITATVPFTATLGTTNGTFSRLYVGIINNGGTMEAAIINTTNASITGRLDEDTLINTSALVGTNSIATFGTLVSGSGYNIGTFNNVPLTSVTGTGFSATANITINNLTHGYVAVTFTPAIVPTGQLNVRAGSYSFNVTVDGVGPTTYNVSLHGGAIYTLGTLVAGSGYTPGTGTYYSIPLVYITPPLSPIVGGTGAIATIVVNSTGNISSSGVTITTPGTGYAPGDILTPTTGNSVNQIPWTPGTQAQIPVSTVTGGDTINSLVVLINGQLGVVATAKAGATNGFVITSPSLGTNSTVAFPTSGTTLISSINTANGNGSDTLTSTPGITGVQSVVLSNGGGSSYAPGNSLSASSVNLGGSGSGFTIAVASVNAGSNLMGTWYSASARTGVPYRVVGFIEITEAIAGNWISAPSLIQGAGGTALIEKLAYSANDIEIITAGSGTTYYRSYIGPVLIEYMASILQGGLGYLIWWFYLNGGVINGTSVLVNYEVGLSPTWSVLYQANGPFNVAVYGYINATSPQIKLTYL